ncbi:MAG TPA: threonine--tRNA ligase [Synergistaceae bacterium]|nr:MAG: Threonine--tRNA ligase [Synergistales bacterium 53_16]KUL05117.1 MAG: Threonine--tRNA ligase [Synergistales bacterium 54_9]MDK2846120.1 threonyl-tRNA synthetase [Synergistales bacterium]HAA47486.1 threonine--tRNA ligase [Synergistaceae bacterium]MDN5336009.1 threonyl-tRNA synthetase [Synergistales bacterium]
MPEFRGPEGQVLENESPIKAKDILKKWESAKGAVAALVDGIATDLGVEIASDAEVLPVEGDSSLGLQILRHSASHLMAQAVKRLYPGTRLGIGPAIEDGFYYDMEIPEQLGEDDLDAIEKEMRRIVKENLPVTREILPKEEAEKLFAERDEIYKIELIKELEGDSVTIYRQGEFVDLCRGPHVENTSVLKHFRLLSVAGAYWRGDERNKMLTRIYGTAFASKEDLEEYINRIEEAKKRDHRKLGRELDLFSLQPEAPGFPFFHSKGMVVVNKLVDFWRKEHTRRGYTEIKTPLILDRDLWIRSGHWDHYRENMYFTEIDERPFAVKPMNCPGGMLVYKSQIRSYRDLPLRMAELGTVHRHERSGVLHGLMRVRCFTQDDAHLYVRPDQIKDEILGIMDLVHYIYTDVFGFPYRVELSTRPEKAMGDPSMWEIAERDLQEALEEAGVPYRINPGDGAFYGPKIDFHLEDCIGRTWQCGTIQLDFQMPEKFDISYIGPDGAQHRPVMLHRTIYGSLERFFGILIEHYAGAFPYWLAPVQVRIVPVSEDHWDYAAEVEAILKDKDVRVDKDIRDEKLGKRIRDAQLQKIPYMIVVGEKEAQSKTLAVRDRVKGDLGLMTLPDFLEHLETLPDPTR